MVTRSGLLLQTPTLLGKMSQFGRQSGGDEGIDSDEDVDVDVTPVRSPSPSRLTISLRDSPSSGWYPSQDSDLERDTAASSGRRNFFRESSPSAVFQPDLKTPRKGRQSKNSELGEAAGCLVSGIYFVSRRGRRSHGREEREDVDEPDDIPIFAPISPEFHEESVGQQRMPLESLEKGLDNFEIHQVPLDFQGPDAENQPGLETNEGLVVPTLEEDFNLDYHEESPVPSGAFVLETPMKYQIGRPPSMVGRSHVNILAHPDRFRLWFDQRGSLSPLAFALCTQAASGYRRLQLNRLFARGSSASQESNRAAFMVLTGRWNTCPGLENGQGQLMESHDSDSEALEAGTIVRERYEEMKRNGCLCVSFATC